MHQVKELLKSVHMYQSYCKSKSGPFFVRHSVFCYRVQMFSSIDPLVVLHNDRSTGGRGT